MSAADGSPRRSPDFIVDGQPASQNVPAAEGLSADLDAAFRRHRFLLRQRLLTISEKYDVWDDQGQAILYMERPAHFFRNLGALLAGLVTWLVIFGLVVSLSAPLPESLAALLIVLGLVVSTVGAVWVSLGLCKKRHVTIYRDRTKQEPLLKVLQVKRFEFPTATYLLRDVQGDIALFRKNFLFDIIRKRWDCLTPAGVLICRAKEDSLGNALLRRFVCGTFFGLLRINFIITWGDSDRVIGEFNRKFTLFDRYILDMSADPNGQLDRRIALALGVLLDTGERR